MDIEFSQSGQDFALRQTQDQVQKTQLQQNVVSVDSQKSDQQSAAFNSAGEQRNVNVSGISADTYESTNISPERIETAVAEISEFVQSQNRQLAFSVDEKSQRSVVKVTDSESGDVIRQIPSEEVLKLSERLKELQTDVGAAVGVLFNKQV